jgi:tetratricopeptide (TPR) repeat protein
MEKSFEANDLRKKGEFEKAIEVYREIRGDDTDPYIIAGLLHCLRKTSQFSEAFDLCEIAEAKHLSSEWCRNEAIWTIIQGGLEKLNESAPIEEVCQFANHVMRFKPHEAQTKWRVIRQVLKAAKQRSRWEITKEWIDKITPAELSNVPMKDDKGREGWCEQSVWYNHKIRALIEIGDKEEAISLSTRVSELFPRQSRFFLRLVALATLKLSRLQEAEQLYADLSNGARPDWWVLQEYAEVLKELGKNDLAIKCLCKAANLNSRLESLVSLFQDIGDLCGILQNDVQALNHYLLCKYVREEKGWSIPHAVEKALQTLNAHTNAPENLKDALTSCRQFWYSTLGLSISSHIPKPQKRNIRYAVTGKVALGMADRPFCFINTADNFAGFCFKSDLPGDIIDGGIVIFDAIPSFDRKKNRESWKAANIRKP